VATPITWDEVGDCHRPEQLYFTADDVLDRVEEVGDIFGDLDKTSGTLPAR
jgi:bifunctional non-homologous end joining protein LigD